MHNNSLFATNTTREIKMRFKVKKKMLRIEYELEKKIIKMRTERERDGGKGKETNPWPDVKKQT